MEIRHLEYFIEVARHKSFSKVAEMAHISQSSISKAIKDLESQLGVTLFYRNTKYVELTDAGEAILEQVQQIVSSFKNITVQLEGLTKMITGKIHIGLPPITGAAAFSTFLTAFKKEFPNIDIHLYEYGAKKIENDIIDGLLDFGICIPPENEELYEKICFAQDPLRVIMHAAHWLASYEVIDYQMLRGEQFVLYDKNFRLHDKIIERCKKAGFAPKIVFETAQLELMKQMVADDCGIALLPSQICRSIKAENIISRPFADPQLFLQLAIIWKKGRYLSHAARELIKFTQNQYSMDS